MKKLFLLFVCIFTVTILSVTAFADTLKESCLKSLYMSGEEKENIITVINSYSANLKSEADYKNPFSPDNYLTIDTDAMYPVLIVDTEEFIKSGTIVLSPAIYDGVQDYQAMLKNPKGEYIGKCLFTISGEEPGVGTYFTFGQNPHIATNDFECNMDKQLDLIRNYGFNEENLKVTFVLCDFVGDCYYVTDGEKEAFLCGGDTQAFYYDNGNFSLIAPVEQIQVFVKKLYLDYQKADAEWKAMYKGDMEDEENGVGGGGISSPATGKSGNIVFVFSGLLISLVGVFITSKRHI